MGVHVRNDILAILKDDEIRQYIADYEMTGLERVSYDFLSVSGRYLAPTPSAIHFRHLE